MIAFPLDATTYSAIGLGVWSSARTRGVLCADNNYQVSAAGNMRITVSKGVGWLKMSDYWGVCCYQDSDLSITLNIGGSLPRYDTVCLQLDKNANKADIVIKQGAYSQIPTYAAPVRDLNYDEVMIAAVYIAAGATSISASNIIDLRLDEDYCGLVRDEIQAIPTQMLYDGFNEWVQGLKGILNDETAGNLFLQIEELKNKTSSLPALGIGYGTCATAASTVAKVGVLSGFVLRTGSIVGLRFSNASTAIKPTLNVNSTGAKPIYHNGTNITSGMITAGKHAVFQYNGTEWVLLNPEPVALNNKITTLESKLGDVYLEQGSVVLTGNGSAHIQLFSASQLSRYGENPTVFVTNGPADSLSRHFEGTIINNGALWLVLNASLPTGQYIRANYGVMYSRS